MTVLKEQFEMVLSKHFHKREPNNRFDGGWDYKNNCTVAFCHNDYVVCYFELDEALAMAGIFNTTSNNEIRVTTPEELELEIKKFLMSEKELIKKHRLKLIKEL